MKILFLGAGVINTIYAWALDRAGHDVTMLVRPGRVDAWADGCSIDVLDARPGSAAIIRDTFRPRIVTSTSDGGPWELIQVSTKHTQLSEVLTILEPVDAPVLFLQNNWTGWTEARRSLGPGRFAIGLPRAGGAITGRDWFGAIQRGLLVGPHAGSQPEAPVTAASVAIAEQARALYDAAGFEVQVRPDMESWQQVHFATTAAWIGGAARSRGFREFAGSLPAIREGLAIGREAMQVCTARGLSVATCEDSRPFTAPAWLSARLTRRMLQRESAQRISAGHGDYAPEELRQIFMDVFDTGRALGVPLPHMTSAMPAVDEMVTHRPGGADPA